jgi:hypothetical protein
MSLNHLTKNDPKDATYKSLNIGAKSIICDNLTVENILTTSELKSDKLTLVNDDMTETKFTYPNQGNPAEVLHTDGAGNTYWSPDLGTTSGIVWNGTTTTVGKHLISNSADGLTTTNSKISETATELNLGTLKCINATDPTDPTDLATKNYVDTAAIPTNLKKQFSTGVISGGTISPNGDTTKFNVSAGEGVIIDPLTGSETSVIWGTVTGEAVLGGQQATYVSFGVGGAIIKSSTRPSNTNLRNQVYVGIVNTPNTVNVETIDQQSQTVLNTNNSLQDLVRVLGGISTRGNIISKSALSLLGIEKSDGDCYQYGVNFHNNIKDPSILNLPFTNSDTGIMEYYQQNNNISSPLTTVNVNYYDTGTNYPSTLIPTGEWAVQRVYTSATTSNHLHLQQAQATFAVKEDAISDINTGAFIVNQRIADNDILLGYIVIQQGETTLANAEFIQAPQIGQPLQIPATLSGGPATTLQQAYTNSSTNQPKITTTVSGGTFSIKTGQDPLDSSFAVQNTGGAEVFSVSNVGGMTTTSIAVIDGDVTLRDTSNLKATATGNFRLMDSSNSECFELKYDSGDVILNNAGLGDTYLTTTASNIYLDGTTGSFTPETNNFNDLGKTTSAWKDLYLTNQANIGPATIKYDTGTLVINNGFAINRDILFVTDAYSVKFSNTDAALRPDAGGTISLGTAAKPWENLYVNSTANIGPATIEYDTGDLVINNGLSAGRDILFVTDSYNAKFSDTDAALRPDVGTISLGTSSKKWKDLHISGGVVVNSQITEQCRVGLGGTPINYLTSVGNTYPNITTARGNVAIGDNTLTPITTGDNNLAIGLDAGALINTGNQNILIGGGAGDSLTTENSNVCIGQDSDCSGNNNVRLGVFAQGNFANSIAIGYSAQVDKTRQCVFGQESVGQTLTEFRVGGDAECDLGSVTHRFKDIYYSGSMIGGSVEVSRFNFSGVADNLNFYNDGNIELGWDAPGNDLEFYMRTAPSGTGDIRIYNIYNAIAYANIFVTTPNVLYDLPNGAGISTGGLMTSTICAEDDPAYPSYQLTVFYATNNVNVVVEKFL